MTNLIEVTKEVTKLELSFSALDTYNLCPRKYYYNYILRLPKKNWPWLVFGNFVHSVLEKFHKYVIYYKKRNKEIDFSFLMKRAYSSAVRFNYRKGVKKPSLLLTDKQKNDAKQILSRHLKVIQKKCPDVLYVEKGFKIKIGDFVIRGFIDRVDKIGDNLYEVIDYKTSSSSFEVDKNKQLAIYAYALKHILNMEDIKINKRLDFVKLNVQKESTYKDKEKEEVIKFIKETGEKILNNKIFQEEDNWKAVENKFCSFCDFKERCFSQRSISMDSLL